MKLRLVTRLAAALGLCVSSAAVAQKPPAHMPQDAVPGSASHSHDQKVAEAVAKRLADSPMRGYQVEIVCLNGVAEVSGTAADAAQRDAIVGVVRSHGLQVRDRIAVNGAVEQVSGGKLAPPVPLGGPMGPGAPGYGPVGPVGPGYGGPGGPGFGGPGGPGFGGPGLDPAPINGGGGALHPPGMPSYAWPTYAPYNNYSRVAYPNEYPKDAFPFIGPMYPFPKVPLGFRAIKLEWEDAHWFYGRTSGNRDWWKVRYW